MREKPDDTQRAGVCLLYSLDPLNGPPHVPHQHAFDSFPISGQPLPLMLRFFGWSISSKVVDHSKVNEFYFIDVIIAVIIAIVVAVIVVVVIAPVAITVVGRIKSKYFRNLSSLGLSSNARFRF